MCGLVGGLCPQPDRLDRNRTTSNFMELALLLLWWQQLSDPTRGNTAKNKLQLVWLKLDNVLKIMFSHFRSGLWEHGTKEEYWQVNYSQDASPSPLPPSKMACVTPQICAHPSAQLATPTPSEPADPGTMEDEWAQWWTQHLGQIRNNLAKEHLINHHARLVGWGEEGEGGLTFRWQSDGLMHGGHQRQCRSKLMPWMI